MKLLSRLRWNTVMRTVRVRVLGETDSGKTTLGVAEYEATLTECGGMDGVSAENVDPELRRARNALRKMPPEYPKKSHRREMMDLICQTSQGQIRICIGVETGEALYEADGGLTARRLEQQVKAADFVVVPMPLSKIRGKLRGELFIAFVAEIQRHGYKLLDAVALAAEEFLHVPLATLKSIPEYKDLEAHPGAIIKRRATVGTKDAFTVIRGPRTLLEKLATITHRGAGQDDTSEMHHNVLQRTGANSDVILAPRCDQLAFMPPYTATDVVNHIRDSMPVDAQPWAIVPTYHTALMLTQRRRGDASSAPTHLVLLGLAVDAGKPLMRAMVQKAVEVVGQRQLAVRRLFTRGGGMLLLAALGPMLLTLQAGSWAWLWMLGTFGAMTVACWEELCWWGQWVMARRAAQAELASAPAPDPVAKSQAELPSEPAPDPGAAAQAERVSASATNLGAAAPALAAEPVGKHGHTGANGVNRLVSPTAH